MSMSVPYNRKQKHVLLFRKSTLKGCLKPRNVTKRDIFYSKILHAYAILEQGVLLTGGENLKLCIRNRSVFHLTRYIFDYFNNYFKMI